MSFNSDAVDIDQVIASLPRDERVIVTRLRSLINECIPQATESTYPDLTIPFYKRNRLICYVWPPSIVGDGDVNARGQNDKGVVLGFNQGYLMSNEDGVLLSEGRKQVYVMYFKKLSNIDETQVKALLFEAAMIDEQFAQNKKKRRRSEN